MSKKVKYYLTQKLVGLGMILLGALTYIILDRDLTVAFFMVPMGTYMLLSKEMILTNKYFFEVHEEEDEEL